MWHLRTASTTTGRTLALICCAAMASECSHSTTSARCLCQRVSMIFCHARQHLSLVVLHNGCSLQPQLFCLYEMLTVKCQKNGSIAEELLQLCSGATWLNYQSARDFLSFSVKLQ
uniref:Putative secreted protein n=1 Tax=Rhipicephalus microplus TaxID=6941 RepID=A0A6G5A134_RHIMP